MDEPKRYGNWEVVRELGRGGQGRVYLAVDRSSSPDAATLLNTLRHSIGGMVAAGTEETHRKHSETLITLIREVATESSARRGAVKVLLPLEEAVNGAKATE